MTDEPLDTKAVPGAISDLYREIATESTPDALDESILAEARRSASKRPAATWPWYRPAVFIGLFGLSKQEVDARGFFIDFTAVDGCGFATVEVGDRMNAAEFIPPSFGMLDIMQRLG